MPAFFALPLRYSPNSLLTVFASGGKLGLLSRVGDLDLTSSSK